MADKTIAVERLLSQCSKAPGYIIFVGIIDQEKKAGEPFSRPVINYSYMRNKFSFDDANEATKEFKRHIVKDMEKIIFDREGIEK